MLSFRQVFVWCRKYVLFIKNFDEKSSVHGSLGG